MAGIPLPNAQVEEARARRATSADASAVRIEWYIDNVSKQVATSMRKRVGLATELVKSSVVSNISRPVTKGTGPLGGRVVFNRSKPGEFPKADTTQLMRTIISDVREVQRGVIDGFIGTPLDYGVILELRMNRSFLARTLDQRRKQVTQILTGPLT